jgi:hypothetical protein
MIRPFIYTLLAALVLFVIIGLFLPREIRVQRSTDIERPAATVFTILNGFGSFSVWSPWAELDPDAEYDVSGPESGVGARLTWRGDPRQVGSGWQEIVESRPYERVRLRMHLEQMGSANIGYRIERIAGGSHVTWGFEADAGEGQGLFGGLLMRYFGLFFDRWIGTDFETGLSRLKRFAESLPATDFAGLEIDRIEAVPLDILYAVPRVDPEHPDQASALAEAFRTVSRYMDENGIEMAAQPMAITRSGGARGLEFMAAIPVEGAGAPPNGEVLLGRSPSGPAVRLVHHGPYDQMVRSYEKLAAYMAAHGIQEGDTSWEQYISDPGETEPNETVTHIYFLVQVEPWGRE